MREFQSLMDALDDILSRIRDECYQHASHVFQTQINVIFKELIDIKNRLDKLEKE